MRYLLSITLAALLIGTLAFSSAAVSPKNVPRMTREQLKPLLGNPDVIVIDVRQPDDYNPARLKIKGAVHEDVRAPVASWMNKYPKEKTLVFYCSWQREATSASVALQFMEKGYGKVYALKGGWTEWVKAGYPTEPK